MLSEMSFEPWGFNVVTEVVKADRLGKLYLQGEETVHALKDFSCSVKSGEFIGIVGPSGSGKSTLLNLIGLADSPSSGELFIDGAIVNFSGGDRQLHKLRRSRIGFVFQHFNLLGSLSAVENVLLPLLLNGVDRSEAQARSVEALTRIGLEGKDRRYPHELSGGEMQRVAICRATVHKPAVILADEPTGSLDTVSGEGVLTLLKDLARSGLAVVMATHSAHAMEFCSRIIELRGGESVSRNQE